jgi:peptide/nickel transport system substrate-binding protein
MIVTMYEKKHFAIIGILLIVILLIFCSGCISSTQINSDAVLKIATPSEITEASYFGNYNFAQMTRVTTPPLIQVDENGDNIGDLAKSWTVSSDGKIWTFTLDPDYQWSDGTSLSAEDVKFSLEYTGEKIATSPAWIKNATISTSGNTVTISLAEPVYRLCGDLVAINIVPKHIWQSIDTPEEYISNGPYVGSAAYYVKSIDTDSATLILAVNPEWKGDAPYYGTIEIHWFATEDAAISAMLGGECDTYWKYGTAFPTTSVALLETSDKFTAVQTPSLKMSYAGFNTITSDVGSDLTFRKAIAYALNYDELVEISAAGYGLSANSGFIPSGVPYYKETTANTYNLETAKSMLDAAGYKDVNGDGIREDTNGDALTVTLLTRDKVAGELIKEYLEKAGLKVEYKFASDINAWIELKEAHTYDIAYNGITAKGMMMDSGWATGYFASNAVGAGKLQNVDDPVFLELCAKISVTPDGDELKSRISELQDYYAEQVPGIALYWCTDVTPINTEIDGWYISKATGIYNEINLLSIHPAD